MRLWILIVAAARRQWRTTARALLCTAAALPVQGCCTDAAAARLVLRGMPDLPPVAEPARPGLPVSRLEQMAADEERANQMLKH